MSSLAALTLTGLVRTGCVVQHGRAVILRGQAQPQVRVHVALGPYAASTHADGVTGRWSCELPPLPVGGPYAGEVCSDDGQRLALEDIYCGQLWLCAGQSNMAMPLSGLVAQEQPTLAARQAPGRPVVRFMLMPMRVAATPQASAVMHWQDPLDRIHRVSAVGYHFAEAMAQKLDMPVGFVQAAVAHTPACAWTARHRLVQNDIMRQLLQTFDAQLSKQPDARENLGACYLRLAPALKQWNTQMSHWLPAAREAFKAGQHDPPMPDYPKGLGNAHTPGVLYNGMLSPLAGEALGGLLWYQGESDAILGYADFYEQSLQGVIESVRDLAGPLPVVVVELPGHRDVQCRRPEDDWPRVRWAQQRVMLRDEATGLVPMLDLGDVDQIHPTRKRELACRAVEIALRLMTTDHVPKASGDRHGPVLRQAMLTHKGIGLHFTGVQGRLSLVHTHAPDAATFEVGRDNQWTLLKPQLIATDQIHLPVNPAGIRRLRYAWAGAPTPILVDAMQWPVSGFEVDFPID